jgi:uncharacterized protein (TIGR04255 family)
MPFPSSDRVIFERNPLAEVVCELRFPPILRIASELPAEFQERIRPSYPNFQQQMAGFNAAAPLPPQGVGNVAINAPFFNWQPQPSFVFSNEAQTRTLTLTQESFAIAERQYTEWPDLRAEIETLAGHMAAVYAPSFYTRTGLRYQDLIDRVSLGIGEVPWAELLNPAFVGLLGRDTPVSQEVRRITSVAEIELADMPGAHVRVQHGLIELPPPEKYLIDSDFFANERSDLATVLARLGAFSAHAGNLFRWAISEQLHTALQPRVPEHHAAA